MIIRILGRIFTALSLSASKHPNPNTWVGRWGGVNPVIGLAVG
jgi:hypothetical protein